MNEVKINRMKYNSCIVPAIECGKAVIKCDYFMVLMYGIVNKLDVVTDTVLENLYVLSCIV